MTEPEVATALSSTHRFAGVSKRSNNLVDGRIWKHVPNKSKRSGDMWRRHRRT